MSVRSVGIIGAGQAGFQTAASLRQSARPEAPTKDRLIGKIMGGNPAFRGTRVPVHMLAELVPSRACARTRYRLARHYPVRCVGYVIPKITIPRARATNR